MGRLWGEVVGSVHSTPVEFPLPFQCPLRTILFPSTPKGSSNLFGPQVSGCVWLLYKIKFMYKLRAKAMTSLARKFTNSVSWCP